MFGSWVIVTAIIIVLVAGVLGVLPELILHRTGATQPAPELAPGRSAAEWQEEYPADLANPQMP